MGAQWEVMRGQWEVMGGHGRSGKPHVRILGVQPEFCRKGGGVKIRCQINGLWQFFSEYEPFTEAPKLHHISPLSTMIYTRIPSKNHV